MVSLVCSPSAFSVALLPSSSACSLSFSLFNHHPPFVESPWSSSRPSSFLLPPLQRPQPPRSCPTRRSRLSSGTAFLRLGSTRRSLPTAIMVLLLPVLMWTLRGSLETCESLPSQLRTGFLSFLSD